MGYSCKVGSEDFELFLKSNGVFRIKTSPYNPSFNGAAENLIRIFKNYLEKCSQSSDLETNIYKLCANRKRTVVGDIFPF